MIDTITDRRWCVDCGPFGRVPVVHYTWKSRCNVCSDHFQRQLHAKRVQEEQERRARLQAHIEANCPDDGEVCSSCCEHEFDSSEGGYCLNCDSHWSD